MEDDLLINFFAALKKVKITVGLAEIEKVNNI
jgi:hypothetical protein